MEFIWILVPLSPFLLTAALILIPRYFRNQERMKMQETLRLSIERGGAIPPDLIEAMSKENQFRAMPSADRDLRAGIIWLGAAVGMASLGFAISFEEPDALYPFLGIAAFPGFIGLALILLSLMSRKK